jgi:hypothetical protein
MAGGLKVMDVRFRDLDFSLIGDVSSVQNYAKQFDRNLQQVGCCLRIFWFR